MVAIIHILSKIPKYIILFFCWITAIWAVLLGTYVGIQCVLTGHSPIGDIINRALSEERFVWDLYNMVGEAILGRIPFLELVPAFAVGNGISKITAQSLFTDITTVALAKLLYDVMYKLFKIIIGNKIYRAAMGAVLFAFSVGLVLIGKTFLENRYQWETVWVCYCFILIGSIALYTMVLSSEAKNKVACMLRFLLESVCCVWDCQLMYYISSSVLVKFGFGQYITAMVDGFVIYLVYGLIKNFVVDFLVEFSA